MPKDKPLSLFGAEVLDGVPCLVPILLHDADIALHRSGDTQERGAIQQNENRMAAVLLIGIERSREHVKVSTTEKFAMLIRNT